MVVNFRRNKLVLHMASLFDTVPLNFFICVCQAFLREPPTPFSLALGLNTGVAFFTLAVHSNVVACTKISTDSSITFGICKIEICRAILPQDKIKTNWCIILLIHNNLNNFKFYATYYHSVLSCGCKCKITCRYSQQLVL